MTPPTPAEGAVLAACPFCGGEAVYCFNTMPHRPEMHWYLCRTCYASPGDRLTQPDAIAAWNRRTTRPAWRSIESAPDDCTTEIDLWCEGIEGGGWNMRGILMPGQPQWLKLDDGTDYYPHENGGYFTHWMPTPTPPEPQP